MTSEFREREHQSVNKSMLDEMLTESQFNFQSFGVAIGIRSDKSIHIEKMREQLAKIFPNRLKEISSEETVEHQFILKSKKDGTAELYRNEEKVFGDLAGEGFYDAVETQIRVTVAEFAVGKVFLHAGVVGWKERAIIIPAQSWSGKTTLVAELVKKGAIFYSDEYAVLDAEGNVEPFPKWLSLRGIIDEYTQSDRPVESLGGVAGTKPIPVGMVLMARYDKAKKNPLRWQPKHLSGGSGIMKILPHALPIRNKPKFVLEVLNKLATRAIIVKTVRGEAKDFAETLLNYFERHTH